jgi:hypothetical protein
MAIQSAGINRLFGSGPPQCLGLRDPTGGRSHHRWIHPLYRAGNSETLT